MRTYHLVAVCVVALVMLPWAVWAQSTGNTSQNASPSGPVQICPCANGVPENEPNCGGTGDGTFVDTVNGGCNSNPVVTSPVSCNQTICGTVGSASNTRDTDWYELVLPIPDNITVTATMETDIALIEVLDPVCPALVGVFDTQPACVQAQINFAGAAGANWIFIAGSAFSGYPCGTEYTMTVACEIVPVELESFESQR